MLFDRKRPGVPQHRSPIGHCIDIVSEVKAGDHDRQSERRIRPKSWADHQDSGKQHEQRRHQSKRSTQQKAANRNAAGSLGLAHQERGDQKPARDEKEVNTDKAAGWPTDLRVMHDHCQRSERPDPIQRPVSSHEACMTSNCLLFSEGSSLTIGGAARGGQYRSAPLRPGCAARRGAGMGDEARQPFGSRRVPVHAGTGRPARAEAQGLMMSASRRRLTARPARSVSRWPSVLPAEGRFATGRQGPRRFAP